MTGDIFICCACDANGGINKDPHKADHMVVRYLRRAEEKADGGLEPRMEAVELRMLPLERRLNTLDLRLEERMSRMEGLLERTKYLLYYVIWLTSLPEVRRRC